VLATLAVAALTCVAAILVGEAAAGALGRERWRGWNPAVGLALILAVALAAVKLPSHGDAGAIALAVLVVVAAVIVVSSRRVPVPPWDAVGVTATTVAAAFLPYLSNGRFGILAVGYTNDPAAHLSWAGALRDLPADVAVTTGYPIGPHSLIAAIANGTTIDLEWVLMGLLFALPVLIGWAALALLEGLPVPRKVLAGTLVAVAYTVSAFYAQAGFKELLLTLFLLAMVGIGREQARSGQRSRFGVGIQLGVLAAGIVVSFSYGGLVWPTATAAVWLALAVAAALVDRRKTRAPLGRAAVALLRCWWPVVAAAAVTSALLIVSDASRVIDSFKVFGSSPAGQGSIVTQNTGHLQGQIPKHELFGFWLREDFRFGFEHTVLSEAMLILALAVAAYGLLWWLWRRDLAVPAAAIATVLISVYLARVESAYTASKALAPAGAFVMLVSIRALLEPVPPVSWRWARPALIGAAVLFAGGALYSSFLVLRGAEVGPRDHQEELVDLRREMLGSNALYLGNDDYIYWELYGVPVAAIPTTRSEKTYAYGQPFDFDSVSPEVFNSAEFTIVTRTAYRSEQPANLHKIRTTPSFELWQRRGTVPARRTLTEGFEPGAVLDCSHARGRSLAARSGWARVWTTPPRFLPLTASTAGAIYPGDSADTTLKLGRGRWEISLQYISRRGMSVDLGEGVGGSLPANLERPGPLWRIGELDQRRPGVRHITLSVDDDPIGSTNHPALITGIAAARVDGARELVPLHTACGRYVDWYTLGSARPRV